jgi:hypothetical protein
MPVQSACHLGAARRLHSLANARRTHELLLALDAAARRLAMLMRAGMQMHGAVVFF